MDTLVERNGWLYIKSSTPSYSKPVMVICYYPLGLHVHNLRTWGREAPLPVQELENGMYLEDVAPYKLKFRLENDGKTKPTWTEEEPIPCPPSRGKKTRYSMGRWQRLLKMGWKDF